jgi:hypothetical protein
MSSNEKDAAKKRFDKDDMSADERDFSSKNIHPISFSINDKKSIDYLQPSDTDPSEDYKTLIGNANMDILKQIVKTNKDRITWTERMRENLENSCELIKTMSVIAFIIGLIFIVIPFIIFLLSTPRDPNLLWFSGIGLAETVAILVYQPINRVQKATSDMMQSTMILNSWATEFGLSMFLLNLKESKGTGEADKITDLIDKITGKHVRWLQHYIEDEHKPNAKQKPKAETDNQTLQSDPKTTA